MTSFTKVGNILKQSVSKQITSQLLASKPSIYQALRCMSSSKVFVGGLSYSIDDTSLREAFAPYGDVVEARVIVDREQNRSRGFGFVTFSSTEEASSAIQALDGQDMHGRRVKVDYATDRAPPRMGGYGGGGYGGHGGYGGSDGYGGGQNYGGGYGGQNYGGNSFGQNTGSGEGFARGNYGIAGGAGGSDPYFGGGAAADNVSADTDVGSIGLADGSTD